MMKLIGFLLLLLASNVSAQVVSQGRGGSSPWLVTGPQTDAEAREYQTASGTITATGQSVTLALNGATGASVNFADSGFDGAFKFYVSTDGGTQYIETQAFNIYGATGGAAEISNVRHGAISGFRIWNFALVGGETHVKVIAASGSSGSVVVTITANNGAPNPVSMALGVPDSASGAPTGALLVMGRDGTGPVTRSFRVSVDRYEKQGIPGVVTFMSPTTNNQATITSTNDTATSTIIANQNVNRYQAVVVNTSSAVLYVLCENGGTAAATRFTKRLQQWESWEVPVTWIGQIIGVWATDPADGVAIVTEW